MDINKDPFLETPYNADIPDEYFTSDTSSEGAGNIKNDENDILDDIIGNNLEGNPNYKEIPTDDIKKKYNLSEDDYIKDSDIPDSETIKRNAHSTAKIIQYVFSKDLPALAKNFVKINKEKLLLQAARGELSLDAKYQIQEDVIVTAEHLVDLYNQKCDSYLVVPDDISEGIKESAAELMENKGKGLSADKRLLVYVGLGIYNMATTCFLLLREKNDIINILKQNKIEEDKARKNNKSNKKTTNKANNTDTINKNMDEFNEYIYNKINEEVDDDYEDSLYDENNDDDDEIFSSDIKTDEYDSSFGDFTKKDKDTIEDAEYEDDKETKDKTEHEKNKKDRKNKKIRNVRYKDIPKNFDIKQEEDDDDNISIDDLEEI